MGGRASRTTYLGSRMMPFFGLSMSRMSCGSAVGTGVGVGGLNLGIPRERSAAILADTERVSPSESTGGAGRESLDLAARTMPEASVVLDEDCGPGIAAGTGVGVTSWAAAVTVASMRARRKFEARFFMLLTAET